MNRVSLIFCFVIFSANLYSSEINRNIIYSDPLPGSKLINRETAILVKPAANIDIQTMVNDGAVIINGSISGLKKAETKLVDNGRVLELKPEVPFSFGETVTVMFTGMVRTNGKSITPFEYSFQIKKAEPPQRQLAGLMNEITSDKINQLINPVRQNDYSGGPPPLIVTTDNNPSNGNLLFSNIVFNPAISNYPYLMIINNNGSDYFTRSLSYEAWNFDKQPNGLLTYFDQQYYKYFGLNSSYNLADTFYTGNGYITDLHELRVLQDGSAYLLSYDEEYVNMSLIYPGGDTNALVTGLIIQEIDPNRNVIFQWRSWDHFSILDATHENFTSSIIDYVHGNALEVESDGNIILSSRHMDEITKINRNTGDIIWRLGGKNNQFTFIGDPEKFSHQHDIRRVSGSNLTLFDNGNFHTPPHSRACEYNVDEVNKTATLVWQYRNTPDYYGSAMGDVQRLPNGNTLISWGATNPTITEVTTNGTKVFEMTLDSNVFTYRAFRYQMNDSLTGITTGPGIPGSYSLSQNYPNPFNPVTKIKFAVPANGKRQTADAKLVIYDVLGREVATIVNKPLQPGSYEVNWDATNSPSGVYFYKLETGDFVQTRKMVLIK